ncbi:hypothetical protein ACFS7Z_22945 [Pontibacter toksunensis]|uniref:Uncharacterized protein n=1 Tax=Pontibacter toksunensis TaxID=1332631 RepID=A0ABW6C1T4_9BACT
MQAKLLLLLLCLSCTVARAQQSYEWRATIPAPAQDGYHSILLLPEVTGRLRPDLADIRVYNAAQQEIPYLLRKGEGYTAIPVLNFTRTDSAATKQTFINLQFTQPTYPEKLELQISSPDLYLRKGQVILGKPAVENRKKRRPDKPQAVRKFFTISSTEPATIELPRQQVQELTLIIENEDNQPLKIAGIKVLQINHYLIADLQPNEDYTLRFCNKAATTPEYDLQFFRDSIPDDLPVLSVTNISAADDGKQPKRPVSKTIMWAAISIVVIGLGYMTVRLLNDMNREKK